MFNIDRSGKAESLSCSTAPPANRGLKRFCSNTRRWDSLINCTVETIYVHIKEKSMKHKSVFIIFFNDFYITNDNLCDSYKCYDLAGYVRHDT